MQKKKGILLISGVERYIEGKEVLLYNVSQSDIEKIKTFDDLRIFKKKKNILVIAPHPFFKRSNCLGKKLLENIDVFDAIEYSHFYLSFFNLNKMAVKIAKKHKLTLIGNSDTHYLKQIEMTYSLIDSKKSIDSIFKAIKKGNVILKTKPISLKYFFWRIFRIIMKSE